MLSFLSFIVESRNSTDKAPQGVLVYKDKYFVGVEHKVPVKISNKSLLDTIRKHGKKHGFYFEGHGGPADIKQPLFGLGSKDDYAGSWDIERMKKIKKEGVKPENLSFVYSNVEVNWNQGTKTIVKPSLSIFKSLKIFFNRDKVFGKHGIEITDDDITDFLIASSKNMGKDFSKIAKKTLATEKNVEKFLKELETVAWPENWSTKKRTKGPEILVDRESEARNVFVLDEMGPGVYFAGSGHLFQWKDLLKSRKQKFKLIGGSKIPE